MKSIAILAVILSGFYIGATKILMSEIKDLENFYSNIDKVATSAADGQNVDSYTEPLHNLQNKTNLLNN